ncbi:hypothetical protein LJC18_04345 [Lachnospiraceae bacterium OttesenSCG-928-E19]|nr:hypothetical protein [Lachnospiraceae bacterium OttesenSCG-928-E19]
MKKVIGVLLITVAICGCSAKIGNTKLPTSPSKIDKQMETLNTKSDVRNEFGTPNLIFDKDGREVYEYKVVSGAGRYHWMIPVAGWVMAWWQDTYTYNETNLFVKFNKSDKIDGWNVIKTSGTTN